MATLFFQTAIFSFECDEFKTAQQISQTIYLTHGIISRSPEIIKYVEDDKIYFKEEFVAKSKEDKLGGMIQLDSENQLYLPLILSDQWGYFTSLSRDFWDKPFHQICNRCKYEWQSKWFEFRCPSCGSTDIGNTVSK